MSTPLVPATLTVTALVMVCSLLVVPGNVGKALCIGALAMLSVAVVVLPCPRSAWVTDAVMYLAVFVCAALLFPLTETVCIRAGLWKHARPDFAGIPFWSPPAWGFTALFITAMHQWARARLFVCGERATKSFV